MLSGVALVALLIGCGGNTPPTPLPQEPASWGREATPPAALAASTPGASVTLTPEEGKALLPVRLVSRSTRTQKDPVLGTDINLLVYTVQVKNNTGHDVAKASGTIYYHDPGGERIDFDDFSIETPVMAGSVITMPYEFVANQTTPSRKALGEMPVKDLRLEFHPKFISYANGVGQEIVYTK